MDGPARKRLVGLLERGERGEVAAAMDRYIEDYLNQLPEAARPERSSPPSGAGSEESRD